MAKISSGDPVALLGKRFDGRSSERVEFRGRGSIITFAPPGSDKDEALILPNLREVASSVVVVDPDGLRYAATADARRAMGQRVLRLDPFRVIDEGTDAIDPFDLLVMPRGDQAASRQALANLIFPKVSCVDRVDTLGFGLLNAVLGYCSVVPEKRTLAAAAQVFVTDDIVYNLAVVLDTIGGKLPPEAYSAIAAFLAHEDRLRSEIISAVQTRTAALSELSVTALGALSPATVSLETLLGGGPFTVYLVLPLNRLRSHALLLRLWIGVIMQGLAVPGRASDAGILFILDECQELLQFSDLSSAMTVGWPTQALLWSIWQSPAQLRARHSESWTAMVENSVALQALAPIGFSMNAELEALFVMEPGAALALEESQQWLRRGALLERLSAFSS